jgi:parallel beta-helix repeat protein
MTMNTSHKDIRATRVPTGRWRRATALPALLATVGLAIPAGAAAAAETVVYVDGNSSSCSDAGLGTAATPFCTIDRAASVAVAGQTVQVASGTYNEEVYVDHSGTSTSPIVFTPAPGAVVTVIGDNHAFKVEARSWVVIRGFRVADSVGDAVDLEDSTQITVADNEIVGSGAPTNAAKAVGIILDGTTNSLVSGNRVHHNSDRGIYLTGASGNTIVGNEIYNNAREYVREASGIHVYRSSSNTLVGNVVHHNEDSGINIYTSSLNNLVANNVSYDNGDHGVDVYSSTGNRVVGNSAYRNATAGLNAEGGSTGTAFTNNIAVDNGIGSPRTRGNIRVDSSSDTSSSMNSDLMFLSSPDVMVIWNGVSYSSVAALRSATGQEPRGLQADPRWRAPGTGDFRLTAGSPAIDSADSGASGQTATDLTGTARVDDPATTNTGVGPRSYDDRGALEFGPAPNAAPDARNDAVSTPTDTAVSVPVLANDIDPDGDPLSVGAVGVPAHGSASAAPNGTISYTPAPGYAGSDSFTYTAVDGRGGADQATVSVTVTPPDPTNRPPSAVDDQTQTEEGTSVSVSVLGNDSDPDGDPLSVTAVGQPDHGSAVASGDGTIRYTPNPAYTGPDQFQYTVGDGRDGHDTATVSVTVTPRNYAGNAGFETSTTGWNTAGSGTGVVLERVSGGHSGGWSARVSNTGTSSTTCLLNDSPNWIASTVAGTYTARLWVRSSTSGALFRLRLREYSGTTLVGSQTSSTSLDTAWQEVLLRYTPTMPGASTLDLNGYTTTTPPGTCFQADDISLTRADGAVQNAPPDARDDTATTTQDTAVVVSVLANDTDPDGDTLTVTGVSQPAHGSVTSDAAGAVTYTPAPGYSGADAFDYSVSDGRGGTDTARVTLSVTASDSNLVANPGFEVSTSGWNASGSGTGVTMSRVSGGHSGAWAARLANTSSTSATCVLNDSPNVVPTSGPGTYTISMWVRSDTPGATFKLRLREYTGSTLSGSTTVTATVTTSWQQVTTTYVATAPGSSTLDLNGYTSAAPPGTCFYADDISVTRR